MRRMFAYLSTTLDGFISGEGGEIDWVADEGGASWDRVFEMLKSVDTCLLGRAMYPEYAQYWREVLAHPTGPLPLTGKPAGKGEVAYARWADRTPHVVVSKTLQGAEWQNSRVVRGLEEVRKLKEQPGKDIYVVGGATLVSNLVNAGLLDELRLTVHPLVVGRGKALFKDVRGSHRLELLQSLPVESGKLLLTYRCLAA